MSPVLIDPLAEMVSLLRPEARFSKIVGAARAWRVRRTEIGHPFYCAMLEGSCRLEVEGEPPIVLQAGDFALIPAAFNFSLSSHDPVPPDDFETAPVQLPDGTFRLGSLKGPADAQWLVGHCAFASPDAALLVSLMPKLVPVRGERRLTTLVQLLGEEQRAKRPAREVITARLLEVLFIEALRSTAGIAAAPGLLRGLADDRLALAIRGLHANPAHPWTIAALAKEAALSRSAFFDRFHRAMGMAPMEYLLAWRMAKAKDLLRRRENGVAEVAERVGYGSASAFSVAFARHVGVPPARYAREAL